MTVREAHDDAEDGSVLILTLGYALLAIALIFVVVGATSLYISQKQLDAVADSAALAGADGFTLHVDSGVASATLTDANVRRQAVQIVDVSPGVYLIDAMTPDGVSARVTVTSSWHPPLISLFMPDGVTLTATATSRNALN